MTAQAAVRQGDEQMRVTRIVFAEKGKLELQSVASSAALKPGEVLIQTVCSLVSAGTELAALSGTHSKSDLEHPPAWLSFPSVPGYLMCGKVLEFGRGVTSVNKGQGVVGEGPGVWNSHCSHLVMEAADDKLVPIAEGVSFEEAVTTKLGSIAMTALRLLKPQLGDEIAVMGLGLVGQMAARLCLLAGAGGVVGIDPIAGRREIASRMPGVEASGHPEAFLQACRIARVRGKIAVLSSPHRFMNIRLYDHIHGKGLQVLGAHGSILPRVADVNDPWTDGRQRRLFMRLLAERRIDVRPLISHRVPCERAPEMYRGLLEKREEYLGVLFYWNGYGPAAAAE